MTNTLAVRRVRQGAGDRHRLGLPVGLSLEPHAERLVDRDHPRAGQRTRALYDRLIARGLQRISRHPHPQRRRLLRLGGVRALRQDHRHLRHRPYPAAAPAAADARRDHGHPGRAAGRAARDQGGQAPIAGRKRRRSCAPTSTAAQLFPLCPSPARIPREGGAHSFARSSPPAQRRKIGLRQRRGQSADDERLAGRPRPTSSARRCAPSPASTTGCRSDRRRRAPPAVRHTGKRGSSSCAKATIVLRRRCHAAVISIRPRTK